MSKARVRVSGSLRGELTIDPLNHILKANNVIFISENEFLSGNVQLAIQKGILLIEYLPDNMHDSVNDNLVQLINTTKKNLSLQRSGLSFKSGDSMIVHKNLLKQQDIIEAMGSGALDTKHFDNQQEVDEINEIEEVKEEKPKRKRKKSSKIKPVSENKRTLSDVKKPEEPVVDIDNFDLEAHFLKVQEDSLQKQEESESKTNMASWSPDEGILNKEASTKAVMVQQNAQILDTASGEINFVDMSENEKEDTDDAFVDENEDAKKRTIKKSGKKKAKKAKKTNNKKANTKQNDIIIDESSDEPEFSDAFTDNNQHDDVDFIDEKDDLDDISFVDEEQERISVPKERIADMNEEIS